MQRRAAGAGNLSAVDAPILPADLDQRVEEFLDAIGATEDRDQLGQMLVTVAALAKDRTDRLDLKITGSALAEMRRAFNVFAPYRRSPRSRSSARPAPCRKTPSTPRPGT